MAQQGQSEGIQMSRILPLVALVVVLSFTLDAQASEYHSERAGHPLRVIAYVLHPVGYLLDRLVFYPAWWLGQVRPIGAVVGADRVEGPDPLPRRSLPEGVEAD